MRSAETQDLHVSAMLPEYDNVEIEISEETWPDIVSGVKAIYITLDKSEPTTKDSTASATGVDSKLATSNTIRQDMPRSSELISTHAQTDEIAGEAWLHMMSEYEI